MQLGAREGGFALSVSALSISGAYGVYTSLITRVREVIWIIIGLALMRIGNGRKSVKKTEEVPFFTLKNSLQREKGKKIV